MNFELIANTKSIETSKPVLITSVSKLDDAGDNECHPAVEDLHKLVEVLAASIQHFIKHRVQRETSESAI